LVVVECVDENASLPRGLGFDLQKFIQSKENKKLKKPLTNKNNKKRKTLSLSQQFLKRVSNPLIIVAVDFFHLDLKTPLSLFLHAFLFW